MSVSERFNLSGKVAVLSGASRGIGLAAATTLAQAGAHVVLTSRKLEALEDAAQQIRDVGGEATPIACHNGELAQIAALFEQVQSKFGRCDILVNNAATNPHYGSVLEVDEKIWDKTVDVNLKGYFFMSQHGAQLMKTNGGGSIINVASINFETGSAAIRPEEAQALAAFRQVQRLDAQTVAGQGQAAAVAFIDRESEHAVQALHAFGAPGMKGLEHDLRVAGREEPVTIGDQLLTQRLVIIDAAVEGDGQAQVGVDQGLLRLVR